MVEPPVPSSSNALPWGWTFRAIHSQNLEHKLETCAPKSINLVTLCSSTITGASLDCPIRWGIGSGFKKGMTWVASYGPVHQATFMLAGLGPGLGWECEGPTFGWGGCCWWGWAAFPWFQADPLPMSCYFFGQSPLSQSCYVHQYTYSGDSLLCSCVISQSTQSWLFYCQSLQETMTLHGWLSGHMLSVGCLMLVWLFAIWATKVLDGLGMSCYHGPHIGCQFLSQVLSLPLLRDLEHWAQGIKDTVTLDVEWCWYLFIYSSQWGLKHKLG